jgi:hypothetical protein
MSDLQLEKPLKKGMQGGQVKLVQEWVTLQGCATGIDNQYGPATAAAVKLFQEKAKLPPTGTVDQATFEKLVAPMQRALKPIAPNGRTLGQLALAYAQQHLKQSPREVGGPNCGPWVRLYMDGNEGEKWYWCAGFATFCVRQASQTLNQRMPVVRSFGVRQIADAARAAHTFLSRPASPSQRKKIGAGSLFLEEGGPTGYLHTGMVVNVAGQVFHTIEGNSNPGGSNNGFEVIARTRSFGPAYDFALV